MKHQATLVIYMLYYSWIFLDVSYNIYKYYA